MELEEVILFKLSLLDLARVSRTCRTFQAAYCRLRAGQGKVHCDAAVSRLGQARIDGIIDVIRRFVMGEPPLPQLPSGDTLCYISADGALHVRGLDAPLATRWDHCANKKDDTVLVEYDNRAHRNFLQIFVGRHRLPRFKFYANRCSITREAYLHVLPLGDDDLEGVGLAYPLTSRIFASTLRDAGFHTKVIFEGYAPCSAYVGCTFAGMQALAMPLLPEASRYTCEKCMWVFKEEWKFPRTERVPLKKVDLTNKKGFALQLLYNV